MAGIERIRSVAARVKREAEAGNEVLVVVSAMAGETDRLVQLCKEASALADPKEYDVVVASGEQVTSGLLAMTLQNMGVKARSFMGWQLVRASGIHGNARVEAIEAATLVAKLRETFENVPQSLFAAMGKFVEEQMKKGLLVDTAGLEPTAKGKRVRLSRGKLQVIDGPFTESKEVVGGYALVEAGSYEQAMALATEFMELHRVHWPEFEGECEVRPLESMGGS